MPRIIIRLSALALLLCAADELSAQRSNAKVIDRANFDTTCAPCTDFYTFANGAWLQRNTIPASRPRWGSFDELQQKNDAIVRDILENAARDVNAGKARAGTNHDKIGAFYGACMDTARIEALGTKPIDAAMGRIAAIQSASDLPPALAELQKSNAIGPFRVYPDLDIKDGTRLIVVVDQGNGLSLPDREYFLSPDTSMQRVREAFRAHVVAMFGLLGETDSVARAHARTVVDAETQFARASIDRVTLRNPAARYHLMSLAQLDSITPNINWESFLTAQGAVVSAASPVNVGQPEFYKAMNGFLTTIPIDDWKTLLRWRLLHASAASLSKRFVAEDVNYRRLFAGQVAQLPRSEECRNATNSALVDPIGQEYIARTFTPRTKARVRAVVDNLVTELGARIRGLDWMSDSAKHQALAKLARIKVEIGHPDVWADFSKLDVRRGDYAGNLVRFTDWRAVRGWSGLGKPLHQTGWGGVAASQVNAAYNSYTRVVVVPAGILQPPFFDPNADDAVNYGAIGAIIGHELTHAFDDQGRRFDADGKLRDWWTKDDAAHFDVQAQRVVEQFNAYTVVDSTTHVNGRLTLGENIATLGGLEIAYGAMERFFKAHGRPAKPTDGFTPEQRFFLGWVQIWRRLERPEYTKARINGDPHSPPKAHAIGPLSNMPEFKAAWGCKDGDAMVRPEGLRARIW